MSNNPPSAQQIAERVGGIAALANAAGVDRTTPYSWTRIPAERVVAISAATGIPMEELRPDLFPAPANA